MRTLGVASLVLVPLLQQGRRIASRMMNDRNPYRSPSVEAARDTAPNDPAQVPPDFAGASWVRHFVVLATMSTSILLYLTRFNISICEGWIRDDLGLSKLQMSWVQGAFFYSYAIAQVPSGWLSDRFGARRMMVIYILGWSVSVAAIGFANSFAALLIGRLAFGVFQAGAYPTANVLLRRWSTVAGRGMASSAVALGGRLGGALASVLSAWIVVQIAMTMDLVPSEKDLTPGTIPYGDAWPAPFFIFGAAGLLVAALYVWIVRDYPARHPWCNDQEQALIADGNPAALEQNAGAPTGMPWLLMIFDRNMTLSSMSQFLVNLTWAFGATLLPQFLKDKFNVDTNLRSWLSSLPMIFGVVGMILGGLLTDWMVRRYGGKWGRAIPMGATKLLGAAAFVAAGYADTGVSFAVLIGLMAFSTDLGVPALWALVQEVGGRHAGAAVGWGNMWGNFGAALSPVVFTAVDEYVAKPHGMPALPFWLGGAIFALSGVCSLSMDATKPLEPKTADASE